MYADKLDKNCVCQCANGNSTRTSWPKSKPTFKRVAPPLKSSVARIQRIRQTTRASGKICSNVAFVVAVQHLLQVGTYPWHGKHSMEIFVVDFMAHCHRQNASGSSVTASQNGQHFRFFCVSVVSFSNKQEVCGEQFYSWFKVTVQEAGCTFQTGLRMLIHTLRHTS